MMQRLFSVHVMIAAVGIIIIAAVAAQAQPQGLSDGTVHITYLVYLMGGFIMLLLVIIGFMLKTWRQELVDWKAQYEDRLRKVESDISRLITTHNLIHEEAHIEQSGD